jgi:tryptophan-rich sensory protein
VACGIIAILMFIVGAILLNRLFDFGEQKAMTMFILPFTGFIYIMVFVPDQSLVPLILVIILSLVFVLMIMMGQHLDALDNLT